nr:PREDICTED: protein spinster homolog 1 [Apteryx mantelli mantelli]
MDRFTVAGVLPDIEAFFSIGDSSSGLLQTGTWGTPSRSPFLQVTPGLGVVAVVLLFVVVKEPPRGAVERPLDAPLHYTSWATDLRALATNRSFVLSTLGFTAVAFVTGALALWAPAFLYRSRLASGAREPCAEPRVAVVCARATVLLTYIFIFVGETLLSLNWAIVADILLYVVVPTRRSTAEALQIVVSHLLGDAGSPYLIGVISDRLRRGAPDSFLAAARSLEHALLLCAFAGALGGGFFLATALFLEGDRRRAQLDAQRMLPAEDGDDGEIVVPQRGRPTKVPVSSVLI